MSINIPVINLGNLYAQGCEISYNSTTEVDIAAGQVRDSTNVNDIVISSAITLNAAAVGANGIDSGSLAASTLYAIYAIGDSTANNDGAVLLSTSATSPVLPAGYDMKRILGYIRTNASSNLLNGYWSGSSNQRLFMYDAPIATSITAGAATSYTAFTLATFVPAIAGLPVVIAFDMTPAAASRVMSLHPYGATGDSIKITSQVTAVHVTGNAIVQAELNSGAPSIEYKWSAGGGDAVALNVAGYWYSI